MKLGSRRIRLFGLICAAALSLCAAGQASAGRAAESAAAGTAACGIKSETAEKTAAAQTAAPEALTESSEGNAAAAIPGLTYDHPMKLSYATQFSVDCYQGGYRLITITGDRSYLVVPDGKKVPENVPDGVKVLSLPLKSVYLAATSAMDFFDLLDCVGMVTLSGLEEDGWYSGKAKEAMQSGSMVFAGKYSEPDYETILDHGCDLAVESTMIYHKPQVKEKLEKLGIPVMVEHSSYEPNPLGRSEWIKLYGVLSGREEEAEQDFEQMERKVANALEETAGGADSAGGTEADRTDEAGETEAARTDGAGKPGNGAGGTSTAFFSINSNGSATVCKTKGYVPKMIEMAGGQYVFRNLGDDNALSTVNMQMEEFYAGAKDADFLVYNSTIEGEIHSISELTAKSSMLEDFRAVKEGNVWCTSAYLFQKPTGIADFIVDLHNMYQGNEDADYTYLYHVDG